MPPLHITFHFLRNTTSKRQQNTPPVPQNTGLLRTDQGWIPAKNPAGALYEHELREAVFRQVPAQLLSIPDPRTGFLSFTGVHLGSYLGTYPYDPHHTSCQQDLYLIDTPLDLPNPTGRLPLQLTHVFCPDQPDDPDYWGSSVYRQSLMQRCAWDITHAGGQALLEEIAALTAAQNATNNSLPRRTWG